MCGVRALVRASDEGNLSETFFSPGSHYMYDSVPDASQCLPNPVHFREPEWVQGSVARWLEVIQGFQSSHNECRTLVHEVIETLGFFNAESALVVLRFSHRKFVAI